MKVVARRGEKLAHEVEMEGGHSIVVDEPPEVGGNDSGPRPTQLLAASLASCTAITMELYAERKGWDVGAVEVEVDFESEGAAPAAFAVKVRLPGELSDEQRSRLLTIAGKCPIHKAIASGIPIEISDRVEAL